MLNLIHLWKNTLSTSRSTPEQFPPPYPSSTQKAAINFDINTVQSSFEFQKSPNVIFVKAISSLEPADFYSDLPEVNLTQEEEQCRLKVIQEQESKNPFFYDGKQIIITGVVYDEDTNRLYLEAKQVSYAFIIAHAKMRFPQNSNLYRLNFFKTGVLAPVITRNGKSMLFQRAGLGLYSVPGGFLEPLENERRLNFNNGSNLVIETAITELKEEIVGIKGTEQLRFEFSKPQISAISFRKTRTISMGTVEFVAPTYADCHSSYLQQVFLNNKAIHAREHTAQHELISLDSQDRDTLLKKLLIGSNKLPGESLYLPVALTLTRLVNPLGMIDLPSAIPTCSSTAWPLRIFTAKPKKSLPCNNETISEGEDKVDVGKCKLIS